jgi:hypothetical protein
MTVGGTLCESFPSAKPKASIAVVVMTRQVLNYCFPPTGGANGPSVCLPASTARPYRRNPCSEFKLQTGARTVARQKQVALSESSNQTSELMPDGVN